MSHEKPLPIRQFQIALRDRASSHSATPGRRRSLRFVRSRNKDLPQANRQDLYGHLYSPLPQPFRDHANNCKHPLETQAKASFAIAKVPAPGNDSVYHS